jgi:hypothetical protein
MFSGPGVLRRHVDDVFDIVVHDPVLVEVRGWELVSYHCNEPGFCNIQGGTKFLHAQALYCW